MSDFRYLDHTARRVPRHPQNSIHPRCGMRVEVTGGKHAGQFGEITFRHPGHVYVRLDGHTRDVLVLIRHLRDPEQENEEETSDAEEAPSTIAL